MTKKSPSTQSKLAVYHRKRSKKSREAVLTAMRQIEAEIATRGYYCDSDDPDKHLRLSVSEVLRRAGVSEAYLRNPRNHDLRAIVQDWLHVQKEMFATSKPKGKKVRRDTIQFYEKALQKVSAEAVQWRATTDTLKKEIVNLEEEIANMRRSDKVVEIKLRSKK